MAAITLKTVLEKDPETAVGELYPRFLNASLESEKNAHATDFASILGIGIEFPSRISDYDSGNSLACERLLRLFRDNVCLLIGKTWVEKHDEDQKAALATRVCAFSDQALTDGFNVHHAEFLRLSADIAVLLFGDVAKHADFPEYAARIDPKLGSFFSLMQSAAAHAKQSSARQKTLEVLLGTVFLSSF